MSGITYMVIDTILGMLTFIIIIYNVNWILIELHSYFTSI